MYSQVASVLFVRLPFTTAAFLLQEDSEIAKWPPPAGYKFCVRGSVATADRMPLVTNRSEQLKVRNWRTIKSEGSLHISVG